MIQFHATEMISLPKWVAEELLKAPSPCAKLYLYGLLRDHAEDVEQIAAETNLSTREVLEGLETLKNLLLVSDDENVSRYTYQLSPMLPADHSLQSAVYDNTEFNMQLQALFSDRILSIRDYATFYECKEVYGLPETVILMLAENCIINHKAKNRLPMSYIRKIGQEWSSEGIDSVALAAEKMESEKDRKDGAREVLRLLGIVRNPSEEEEKLYQKWIKTWGFSFGGIRAAMAGTTSAYKPSMKYLDKILEDLYSRGKVTKNDITQHFVTTEQTDSTMKKLLSRLGIYRAVTDDLRNLYSRWRTMGFTEREILYAGTIANTRGYGSVDHVDKLLTGWRMKNLTKLEDIEALLKNDEERKLAAEALLSCAGVTKSITKTDIERYERLVRKYGFSTEIMLYAAECAYGYNSPMKAIETILSGWHDAHITTLAQAQQEHRDHHAKLSAAKKNPSRFDERSYSREELDARIDDPLKDLLEGLEE